MKRPSRKSILLVSILGAGAIAAVFIFDVLPGREPEFRGRSIMAWSRDLNSPDPEVRSNATAAVRAIGSDAVPFWTKVLQRRDPLFKPSVLAVARKCPSFVRRALRRVIRPFDAAEDRLAAVRALETLGPTSPIEPLFEALGAPDPQVASIAVNALGRLGQPAVPGLILALEHTDPEIRSRACTAVSIMGPKAVEAVPALLRRLDDPRTNLQSQARFALGRIGGPALLPILNSLKSPDSAVRATAVVALGFILPDSREVVTALVEVTRDPSPDVRRRAIEVLGNVRPRTSETLSALTAALQDSDAAVRARAGEALLKIKMNSVRNPG